MRARMKEKKRKREEEEMRKSELLRKFFSNFSVSNIKLDLNRCWTCCTLSFELCRQTLRERQEYDDRGWRLPGPTLHKKGTRKPWNLLKPGAHGTNCCKMEWCEYFSAGWGQKPHPFMSLPHSSLFWFGLIVCVRLCLFLYLGLLGLL